MRSRCTSLVPDDNRESTDRKSRRLRSLWHSMVRWIPPDALRAMREQRQALTRTS
jgi:hypothetical protein